MVKFVGEGGHDVGGLFNESLVRTPAPFASRLVAIDGSRRVYVCAADAGAQVGVCNEVQSEGPLKLFIRCPNHRHELGENREKWLPNPEARSPTQLALLELVGRIIGQPPLCTRPPAPLTQLAGPVSAGHT